jgi:superfamily II DNA or RNA helicase
MIKIIIDSRLTITGDIPKAVAGEIKKRLTIENPKWIENNKYGYWNGETPQWLTYYEDTENGLIVPRGCQQKALEYLHKQGLAFEVADRTRVLPEVDLTFQGVLHPYQQEAADKILAKDIGVAQMPTGAGKTVVALYCIAQRRQPALVIVHTKELLSQWVAAASKYLGLASSEVGIIGSGNCHIGKKLTIAINRSLYTRVESVRDHIGFFVVDECHKVPARTFADTVSGLDSRYMLGLSATPKRRDGLTRLIYLRMGDRVVELNHIELQGSGHIMGAELIIGDTDFDYPYADDYQAMLKALAENLERNKLIAQDVIKFAKSSRFPALLVSDRKSQCQQIADLVRNSGIRTEVLTGDLSAKKRQKIVADLDAGEIAVLISTTQLIGEGFDNKKLSALFLATPIKSASRVQQVVGRILRTDLEKVLPKIYDYRDQNGVLLSSFKSRLEIYQQLGITLPN